MAHKWDIISKKFKEVTAHICALLKPFSLRIKIENDLEHCERDIKKIWQLFYKYFIKKAVACEEFAPISLVPPEQGRQYILASEQPKKSKTAGASGFIAI